AAIPVFNLCLLGLSSLAVHGILKHQYKLPDAPRRVLFFAYLMANTVLVQYWFGEREQMIVLGLFPMALLQVGVTRRLPPPPEFKMPVLLFGSIAALIKPLYLLVPGAIFVHRAIKQKRLSVAGDLDFAVMTMMFAIYVALLVYVFGNYVDVILPDAMKLYVMSTHYGTAVSISFAAALALGFALAAAAERAQVDKDAGAITATLIALALLCLTPCILQDKGYLYHFIPAMVFAVCGLSLLAMPWFGDRTGTRTCVILSFFCYLISAAPMLVVPHHDTMDAYPLTAEASRGAPECSYFLFDNVYNVQTVANYAGCEHASRFSDLWFLQTLLGEQYAIEHNLPHKLNRDEIAAYSAKFAALVTEDLKRWKPDTIIVARIEMVSGQKFNFEDWFSEHDHEFALLWQGYKYEKEVHAFYPHFLFGDNDKPGSMDITYEIYRKQL
ncbi:MAG TPA: hypothetical protein VL625_10205, partial [Patescibacteria group bacterium]|nr:hypothetical protein [Patescibacteria group bacterium]